MDFSFLSFRIFDVSLLLESFLHAEMVGSFGGAKNRGSDEIRGHGGGQPVQGLTRKWFEATIFREFSEVGEEFSKAGTMIFPARELYVHGCL